MKFRSQAEAIAWGKKLARDVERVIHRYPAADPETVRLVLISLQLDPLDCLRRSLRRGRGFAALRR